MDAVAGDADDPVAGDKVAADDDAVERHGADRGADQIEAAHDVRQLRDLAAGDRDAGLPRALGEADRDAVEHRRVGLLDRDVIDHRHRPRPDAQEVVDVHRDAVDADRVVLAHHLRDDRLRADPVGGDRKPETAIGAADIDDVGEIADRQLHRAEAAFRPAGRPSRGDAVDDVAQPGIGLGDIDAGRFVARGDVVSCAHGQPQSVIARPPRRVGRSPPPRPSPACGEGVQRPEASPPPQAGEGRVGALLPATSHACS